MKKNGVKKSAICISAFTTLFAFTAAYIPSAGVASASDSDIFPYAMFASSNADGAITVNSKHFNLNGNIASNGTIVSKAKGNFNGKKTENADKDMLFIGDKINAKYFSNANVIDSPSMIQSNLNIKTPLDAVGDAYFKGNLNVSSSIKADNDIVIEGNVSNISNSVIYSEFGDITIDCNNVNLTGIVYAPLGNVEITANNINLNSVVIIADTITLNSNNINANYSSSYGKIAGNESESKADYIKKYTSWLMDEDIEATKDLISQYYKLTPVDTGEYAQLNIMNMMFFDVEQYEVEGYGNLSIMKTDGMNQMTTIVLTPFEKDLPLISTDYMYNGEQRISYIEFYGLLGEENSADYRKVIDNLKVLDDDYKDLMTVTPTSAWYDEIRTFGLYKMTGYADDAATSQMLSDSFRITLDASKGLPYLNAEQKAVKLAATKEYSNNLVDMGGVSTDIFKMALGVDKTKDFFNNVFFGTSKQ